MDTETRIGERIPTESLKTETESFLHADSLTSDTDTGNDLVNIVKESTNSNTIETVSGCEKDDSSVPSMAALGTVAASTFEMEHSTSVENPASSYASDESSAACDLLLKSETEADTSVQSDANKKHFSCFERYIPIGGGPDNADDSLASTDIENVEGTSNSVLRPDVADTFLSVKPMNGDDSLMSNKLDTESVVSHSLDEPSINAFHPPPAEETMMAPPSVDAADVREFFEGGEMDNSMSESTGFSNLSAGITTHLEATEEARRLYAETDSESNLTTASDAKLSGISTPKRRASVSSATDILPIVVHYGSRFPAENLFEYQWPPETGAEWFMLQEQISEYLEVKSFKRKYPELHRRAVDMKEKEFLKERGVVTETQCDLGLTALRSDEVCDLLASDYPEKYQEYARVLHEKEKQTISNKYKQYSVAKVGKDKLAELVKKAVRSAAEFNAHFQHERREERQAYFDLQTMTIHYPKGRFRVLPASATKVSAYPVSLVPGQFQEHFREYTPDELRYFPLRTTVYGAPKKMQPGDVKMPPSDHSSEDTSNESPDDGDDSESESEDLATSGTESHVSAAPVVPSVSTIPTNVPSPMINTPAEKKKRTPGRPKGKRGPPASKCRICSEGKDRVQIGITEELVSCSMCKSVGHPTCLELTEEMIPVIKTYPWQCMECKTCVMCMDPYDEDKMMFCDKCDRGYHTFCVGVKAIPTGRWECSTCKSDHPPPHAPPQSKAKRGRR